MAHITEINISGLAGRKKDINLTLDRNVNIFYGLNGSGKSSLLKIIHSAMSNNADILKKVPFHHAELKIYSIMYKKIFTYTFSKKIKKASRHRTQDGDAHSKVKQTDKNEAMQWKVSPQVELTRWEHKYLPTSRLYFSEEVSINLFENSFGPREDYTEDKLDTYYSFFLQHLWSNYSSIVFSAVQQSQEHGLINILRAIIGNSNSTKRRKKAILKPELAYERLKVFLQRRHVADILGDFEDFKSKYMENVQLQKISEDINKVEREIEIAMAPRNRFQELLNNMITGNKSIVFKDEKIEILSSNKEDIGLTGLSSGEKHLLRILIDAMMVRESTIIVDEPELSMHIDWQRSFINDINTINPNAQLIVATHSPEIMAEISDDRIFSL